MAKKATVSVSKDNDDRNKEKDNDRSEFIIDPTNVVVVGSIVRIVPLGSPFMEVIAFDGTYTSLIGFDANKSCFLLDDIPTNVLQTYKKKREASL